MQATLHRYRLAAKHAMSRLLHIYADFRIGATEDEKHCYKHSDSILLTFDDYGSAAQINDILAILQEKGVRAMFFVRGDWAGEHPELVGSIRRAGHIVGNHTFGHIILRGRPAALIEQEITNGVPSAWLRPPEGRYDTRVRKIAARLGYAICYWTIDSRDWTGASVADMRHTILSELHPGAVILCHINGKHTRALLPELIDDIRRRGYTLTDTTETWEPPMPATRP